MMSEGDKELTREAKGCTECIPWLKNCNAECCYTIYLENTPVEKLKESGRYITVNPKERLSPADFRYYRLHGVECTRGLLRFEKALCITFDNRVVYWRKCDLLDENNLCKGHPDMKPPICKFLTLETSRMPVGFRLTPNCLFKYKNREVELDEEGKSGRDSEEEVSGAVVQP